MIDTAISRIIRATITGIVENSIILFILCIEFPNKDSIKCPAIMLAVNRTDKVMGRIMFLVSSIITITGSRAVGVPVGTMCASIMWGDLIHPNNIRDSHRTNAKGRFNMMWLVGVKM